jgi:hypothetical protein
LGQAGQAALGQAKEMVLLEATEPILFLTPLPQQQAVLVALAEPEHKKMLRLEAQVVVLDLRVE